MGSDTMPSTEIYSLANPFSGAMYVDLDFGGDPILLLKGEQKTSTLRAAWAGGNRRPSDIVWTTDVGPVLISERVRLRLEEEEVSGWRTIPSVIVGKEGEVLEAYHFLIVLGRCGPVELDRGSELERLGTWVKRKGVYFLPDSWDGSDVFMASGESRWVFTTEKARRVFSRAEAIANVGFEPLGEVDFFDREEESEL